MVTGCEYSRLSNSKLNFMTAKEHLEQLVIEQILEDFLDLSSNFMIYFQHERNSRMICSESYIFWLRISNKHYSVLWKIDIREKYKRTTYWSDVIENSSTAERRVASNNR